MAESQGGAAAAILFDDLIRAAGEATQRIRAHLSPRGTMKTWLGQSAQLAEVVLSGSVLTCESSEVHPTRIQWDGQCDWRSLIIGAPSGRVTLTALIGEQRVAEWHTYMQRYQAAFDAVRAHKPVADPGEFLVRESELPAWAQPFVWEAVSDSDDYRPVVRSDRDTVFPGRQVDRARMREVVSELRWRDVDPDICDHSLTVFSMVIVPFSSPGCHK